MTDVEIGAVLHNAFANTFNISEVKWKELAEFSRCKRYPKDTLIKRYSETEKNLYFIVRGSAGSFSFKSHKRICIELCYENEFFGEYVSLLTGIPSNIETQTLEESVLIKIPFDRLLDFYGKQAPLIFEKIGRLSAEFLLFKKHEQLIDLQTLTAEERYKKLLQQRPDLLQRTSLKHIASYLSITPESFSRIRKKIRE